VKYKYAARSATGDAFKWEDMVGISYDPPWERFI